MRGRLGQARTGAAPAPAKVKTSSQAGDAAEVADVGEVGEPADAVTRLGGEVEGVVLRLSSSRTRSGSGTPARRPTSPTGRAKASAGYDETVVAAVAMTTPPSGLDFTVHRTNAPT
jgi:hypothetical protein